MKKNILTAIAVLLLIIIYVLGDNETIQEQNSFLSIQNKLNKAKTIQEQENILYQYGLQNYSKNKIENILSEIEMKEYANYVNSNIQNVKSIAIEIGIKNDMSQKDKLKKVLDFMIYEVKYQEDEKNEDILKSINATYKTKLGDCEDQSILAAALLSYIGYETYIFHRKSFIDENGNEEGGHVFVGIKINNKDKKSLNTFRIENPNNKTMYLKAFELTGKNANELAKLKKINDKNKKGQEVMLDFYKVQAYNLIINKKKI